MRKITTLAASILATTCLVATGAVAGAQATPADSKNTDATFTIAGLGGALEISSAPAASAPLGFVNSTTGIAEGLLGTFSVRDRRDPTPRGWTASVQSSDFINQAHSTQIVPAANVRYRAETPLAAAAFGSAGTADNKLSAYQESVNIGTATSAIVVSGITAIDASWTWSARLQIDAKAGDATGGSGQYKGTITTSVI